MLGTDEAEGRLGFVGMRDSNVKLKTMCAGFNSIHPGRRTVVGADPWEEWEATTEALLIGTNFSKATMLLKHNAPPFGGNRVELKKW